MKKKLLFICLGLISIAVILYWLKVPHLLIGRYLAPSDNLSRADAIVVVSGDSDRMRQAIDLYKQGYAPKLILSGAARDGITSNALAMHIEASQSGIPNEAVILEEKANNTYENALYTKEIVLSQGMQNIILVTSPYHQRRVYETFKNVFKGFIGNEFSGGVLRVSKGHLGIFKLHHTPIKDSDDSEIIFHRFSIAREVSDINKSIPL